MNTLCVRIGKKHTDQAILRGKQEWARTFDAVPDLIAVLDDQHRIVHANRAMAERLGKTPATCIGSHCYEILECGRNSENDCPHIRALAEGREHVAEMHLDRLGGDFLVTTTPLMNDEGRMLGAVQVVRDITKHKKREDELRRLNHVLNVLSHSDQILLRATQEEEFLEEACELIVNECGHAMAWIGFVENDEARSIRPAASAGQEDGYLDAVKFTWADTGDRHDPAGTAVRTMQVCQCRDLLTTPPHEPWHEEAVKHGYVASVALPLMSGHTAFGVLTVFSREPGGFTDEETRLLRGLSSDFAQEILMLRARAERDLAERAVRASEEQYRTLFGTMTEGFALHEIICDREGNPRDYRFLDVNPAFERLTGLRKEHVVGKTAREVMPGIEPIWIQRCGRVALTGEPDHFETVSADLGRHYRVTAYRTAERRFAAILDDITELKLMQKREREDAIRLAWGQAALDTINVMREGVVMLEMDGTIISVNPAVELLTGLTGGAIVGRNVESLLPELLAGVSLKAALRGLVVMRNGGIPKLPTLHLKRPDGRILNVLPSMSTMAAPDGGRQVVLTLRDVTDLHEAQQRLKQSERKYRELVENTNSIIMRIMPDHTITFFNEFAQKFFGYEAGEVVGRNVLGLITPEVDSEGRDLRPLLHDIAEDPEKHGVNENENICKDGRRVWVHWANQAIRDSQGRITEILCVGTDITRRRELEMEVRRDYQHMRDLAERLMTAGEEERWRLSRHINDTIIQINGRIDGEGVARLE